MKLNDIVLLIIGIRGVGKEHLRAAYNLGIRNVVLMGHSKASKDEYLKGLRLGYVWNEWDIYKEKILIPENAVFVRNFNELQYAITHTIIATPTSSHYDMVQAVKRHCRGSRILLEKPISEDKRKIKVDYVGYNYSFNFDDDPNVLMLVNSKKHPGKGKIEYDLLSHLIYLALLYRRGIKSVYKLHRNFCSATTKKGDLLLAVRNERKHFVYFNKIVKINYSKLFTEQLRRFIHGESNYPLAVQAESYLL